MSDRAILDSVPKYSDLFQPVLDALKELGGSGQAGEVRSLLVAKLGITDEMLEPLTKGGQPVFHNRIDFSRFYLVKTGYIDSSERGVWTLTEKGADAQISSEENQEIRRKVKTEAARQRREREKDESSESEDPEIEDVLDHRATLRNIFQELPPSGFERLCQRLLRESDFEQVTVTGRSGDGGIDGHGVLKINAFVSHRVLFQCKRYNGSVGSSVIRDFRGAMMGRADKGIILTTGTFTPDARREAIRDGAPAIELVDGESLLDLFESLKLGLKPKKAFDVDERFFAEFREA